MDDDAALARRLNRHHCGVDDPSLGEVLSDYFWNDCRQSDDESEYFAAGLKHEFDEWIHNGHFDFHMLVTMWLRVDAHENCIEVLYMYLILNLADLY